MVGRINMPNKITAKRRIFAGILTALMVLPSFCITIPAFAEEITSEISQTENTERTETESDNFVEPVPDLTDIPTETLPETTAKEETTKIVPQKEKYKIMFSLFGVKNLKKITVKVVSAESKKEYELVFSKNDDFFLTTELPVGEYRIKEIKTDDKFIKASFDMDGFSVKENDMQSYSINVTQTETNAFLKLLYRNWLYLVMLAALLIVFFRIRKKNAIS